MYRRVICKEPDENALNMKLLWPALIVIQLIFSVSAQADSAVPSLYCGAEHNYVCTPEQALVQQRRQMQQRQAETRSNNQQSMARWLELQQRQRMQMEREALLVQPAR